MELRHNLTLLFATRRNTLEDGNRTENKPIMAKRNILYVIALVLILLTGGAAQAVTKTWDGAPGTGLDWTLPANWSDDIAPIAGDDIVFNTPGTYDFSTLPASVAYNSISVLQGNVTFAGST